MATSFTSQVPAETLLEEHQELLQEIDDVRQFEHDVCELGIGPKCGELADRMAKIRELLDHHFAAEEKDGYLASALELAPQFAPDADVLLAQHANFLARLDRMLERLRQPESEAWNDVCRELDVFLGELQAHEHRENTIMQSAFNEETGGGD